MILIWTEAALADLRAIEEYIARDSLYYGRNMVERIFARVEQIDPISAARSRGAGIQDESLRELLESPYRLVYRAYPERVEMLAVVHAARQMPTEL